MAAYYNEIDPFAAEWLRALVRRGLIAPGDVDQRSIADVRADDLVPYVQCHFFAGIGGWSLALRLAGWPDDRPVWTGSCPCQPFSVAGSGRGTEDERHLWPVFAELIRERRPPAVFGEQVASAAGRDWLSSVRADLEGMAYAVGAADLCAAGVGAPHIRQRLFWVGLADSGRERVRSEGHRPDDGTARGVQGADGKWERLRDDVGADGSSDVRLVNADSINQRAASDGARQSAGPCDPGIMGRVEVPSLDRLEGQREPGGADAGNGAAWSADAATAASGWDRCEWIPCADRKSRPLEPGTSPLVDGLSASVGGLRRGSLRGYGNAIVPQVAAVFIGATMSEISDNRWGSP